MKDIFRYILFAFAAVLLEPIQDLPVRRLGGDFFAPQGKKPPEYLLYYKVF